jgi:thioredoxin-related protein
MFKKILSLFFMAVILGLVIWLLWQAAKEETLPVGASLPVIAFTGKNGVQKKIEPKNGRRTIVVYFSTTCEHCRYQLKAFNDHIEKLVETDIFFLTPEPYFFRDSLSGKWEHLNDVSYVQFGIIAKKNFEKSFGAAVTPSLFFFNVYGRLKEKVRGELKPQKIIEITKSLTLGQAQSSGKNKSPSCRGDVV